MIRTVVADGKTEYEVLRECAGIGLGGSSGDVYESVYAIIDDVRARGDEAIFEYGKKFDGFVPERLKLTREDMKRGYDMTPVDLRDALTHAAKNIRAYHKKQVISGYETKRDDGVVIGQMVRGMSRVGIYVPGGTAAYPSTVLMNAIPAKLAEVEKIIMVTPPRPQGASVGTGTMVGGEGAICCEHDGVSQGAPVGTGTLAAAFIAGVDEIILAGGAQAVAGLAFGTETFPRVDKIVGPGNIYVATAKRILYGIVDIEMIAGPSEILIMADEYALPRHIAADMLSQAEHDPDAASILLTTSSDVAGCAALEVSAQLAELPRREIAEKSIANNGLIIVCRSVDEMVKIANEVAPEHLEIMTEDSLALVPRIKNAGSVFCGAYSPEPLGDYYSGTNHVLPTSGTARYASPLGVYDFVKRTSYTYYTKDALAEAKDDIVAIGKAEGLTAHVAAVEKRFE